MCRSTEGNHGMGCEKSPAVQRECGRCGPSNSADADICRGKESPETQCSSGNGQGSRAMQGEDTCPVSPNQPGHERLAGHGQADGLRGTGQVCDGGVEVFPTGAIRSILNERLDLIPFAGLRRVGMAMAHGAEKYGTNNWQKGFPLESILNHALVHIYRHLSGDRTEDHLGHAAANLLMACHTQEKFYGDER